MQPSEYEIQREVEALRDIRRRSTANNGVTLDPDLPTSPSSPTAAHQYWNLQNSSRGQTATSSDGDSSSDSHEDSSTAESNGNPADDPFHLFWVPASLHPEIAPAEFRNFLKEHSSVSGDGSLSRSASSSSTSSGLGRKRSMLSRQYKPSENDGVENEEIVPLRRNKSSMYTNHGPQLTINDLQRLEELAEEAQASDDPSKLRTMLRRSLSMNVSPSVIDTMDNMPEMGDEADAPIIVPPPGQILRRAARTKIRKPGLPGDGGGHRFGASRRGGSARSGSKSIDRISGDLSDAAESSEKAPTRKRTTSESITTTTTRPESYSEETSIYESYVRDDDDGFTVISPPIEEELETHLEAPSTILEALAPVLHQPQPHQPLPQTLLPPTSAPESPSPSRTPSPVLVDVVPSQPQPQTPASAQTPSYAAPQSTSTPILQSPPPGPNRKDKEKKGLFGKWGSDKNTKRGTKEKGGEAEKEKEASFFGSLFGSKKKQEDGHVPIGNGHSAGRETAAALLGASKSSKSNLPPLSPGPVGGNPWARYPIHVERAIYRLSHIKLANPRRPLYEQVLISNLMFWYLGVINKTNNPTPVTPPPENQQPVAVTENGEISAGPEPDVEEQQRQENERQEKERLERERLEKEKQEKEALEAKKKESPRRGPLTRPAPAGAPRRAEMPVRGPQYEMQHRVMEQEYGKQEHYQRGPVSPPQSQHAPKLVQPQPTNYVPDNFYYGAEHAPQPQLPAGAMAPVDRDQTWQRSSPRQTGTSPSPPPAGGNIAPHRRSRSPPQSHHNPQSFYAAGEKGLNHNGGHRTPSRSMSAVATPTAPQTNGRSRKGASAHAVAYTGRPRTADGNDPRSGGEEEDVPLAVWQQRKR